MQEAPDNPDSPLAARSHAFDGPSNGARQVMLRRPRTALHAATVPGNGGFFRFDVPIDTVEQLRK